jgi:hypothetical protein
MGMMHILITGMVDYGKIVVRSRSRSETLWHLWIDGGETILHLLVRDLQRLCL